MSDILKKYVCIKPFTYLDVHQKQQWLCCPSWAPQGIRPADDEKNDLLTNWNSYLAKNIRKSVLDGSYNYCDDKVCPSLNELKNTGKLSPNWDNFITKESFVEKYNIQSVEDVDNFTGLPVRILFGFDRSCNLKCPSCRTDLVKNDDESSPEYIEKKNILATIENDFSKSLEFMMITGSGDPFYSTIFRDSDH
jgi:hypothetical protein